IPEIPANTRWAQNGVTVAGGHGYGSAANQLKGPYGLFVDAPVGRFPKKVIS
ncbi:unnamed protein product, partial [Rotaria magnacalcarata]